MVQQVDKHFAENVVGPNDLWEQLVERDLCAAPVPVRRRSGREADGGEAATRPPPRAADSAHPVLDASAEGAALVKKTSTGLAAPRGHIVTVKRYRDRSLKELYQMVHTGKFVERRFEDRPMWQKVAIVFGSIVLSPFLILYLLPKIAKNVYFEALVPAVEYWGESFGDAANAVDSFEYAAHSWAATKHRQYRRYKRLPFASRPLWCQCVIVIFTALSTPYWLVRYFPSIARKSWRRFWERESKLWARIKAQVAQFTERVLKPVARAILEPIRSGIVWSWRWARYIAAPFVRDRVLVPVARGVKSAARMMYRGVLRATTFLWDDVLVGFCYRRVLVPTSNFVTRTVKAVHNGVVRALRFAWYDVLVGVCWRRILVPTAHAVKATAVAFYEHLRDDLVLPVARFTQRTWNATVYGTRRFVIQPLWSFSKMVVRMTVSGGKKLIELLNATAALIDRAVLRVAHMMRRAVEATAEFVANKVVLPIVRAVRTFVINPACQLVTFISRKIELAITTVAGWIVDYAIVPVCRGIATAARKISEAAVYVAKAIARGVVHVVKATIRAIRITGSFLWTSVLRPIGRAVRDAIKWVHFNVIVRSVRFCILALTVTTAFTWYKILCPAGRFVRSTLAATGRGIAAFARAVKRAIGICARFFWAHMLCPVGRAIKSGCGAVASAFRVTAAFAWNRVLCPVGRGVKECFRAVVTAFRVTASFAWLRVLCPIGRGIKTTAKFAAHCVRLCSRTLYDKMLCPIGRGIKATAIATKNGVAFVVFGVVKPAIVSVYAALKSAMIVVYRDVIVASARAAIFAIKSAMLSIKAVVVGTVIAIRVNVVGPAKHTLIHVIVPNVKAGISTAKYALKSTADAAKQGVYACYEGMVVVAKKVVPG